MPGPKTAILLQTLARTAKEGSYAFAARQAAKAPAPRRRGKNAKTGGCTPCEAMARVQAARVRAGLPARK